MHPHNLRSQDRPYFQQYKSLRKDAWGDNDKFLVVPYNVKAIYLFEEGGMYLSIFSKRTG